MVLEVGLSEHRTQRGKNHTVVGRRAPWDVALFGFSRVEEARKPSLTPAFLPQSACIPCVSRGGNKAETEHGNRTETAFRSQKLLILLFKQVITMNLTL